MSLTHMGQPQQAPHSHLGIEPTDEDSSLSLCNSVKIINLKFKKKFNIKNTSDFESSSLVTRISQVM